jgi:nucleolar complex protein 3
MLEALFEVYFRVLKACTASPALTNSDAAADKAASEQPGNSNRAGSVASTSQPAASPSQQQRKGKGGGSSIRQAGQDVLAGAIAPGMGLPRDRMLKKHPLLYPVLEGLGRYAHLISVEYFNDLMAVFHEVGVYPNQAKSYQGSTRRSCSCSQSHHAFHCCMVRTGLLT